MKLSQDFECRGKRAVPWGCAGAIMFDRSKFEMLGGFDSTFFLDYEDLDICWRGALCGWKTIFVPEARLYHKVGESEDEKLRRNNPAPRKSSLKINVRRQLSQSKNIGRFVLKTMPWPAVVGCFFVETLRIFGNLVRGHFLNARLQLRALIFNFKEMPEILELRRKIKAQAVLKNWEVLKQWDAAR